MSKNALDQLLGFIGNPRKNSSNYFMKEYLLDNDRWKDWISVSDVSDYCSCRRKEEVNQGFRDPPRAFESFRKDKTPCHWEEKMESKVKFVKFRLPDEGVIMVSKDHGFTQDIIDDALKKSTWKCEITGLPACEGKLAADHWYPKEKGGESSRKNCVILNKILNEKKNNHLPDEWFCKHLLTNFLNICKRMGGLDIVKEKLIEFIQEFE